MNKSEIIFLSAALVFVAIRLYMKYGKKRANGPEPGATRGTTNNKDDDYEPYSGR